MRFFFTRLRVLTRHPRILGFTVFFSVAVAERHPDHLLLSFSFVSSVRGEVSDLDVRTLYGGGRWCRRRMRVADGDERRRRMKDIPTGKLGPAGSRISFVYIEVPYFCTNKSSNQSSILFDTEALSGVPPAAGVVVWMNAHQKCPPPAESLKSFKRRYGTLP